MANASILGGLAMVLDASEAQVRFALLAGRFTDYTPVLKGSVRTTLLRMEELQFSTEGAAFGHTWQPLAPSTLRAKASAGLADAPILVRRGDLRLSLTTGRKARGAISTVTPFSIVFGTSNPVAEYHQQPDGPVGGKLPQRQVIPDPLPDAVMEELRENIRDYLIEGRIRGREQ